MHVSNLYGSPQGEALAQRIVDNCFADTVFFTNSGAEAIECAIKTARRYFYVNGQPNRTKIITFNNAFHGRTIGAISATDQPKMRDGFEPLLPGFDYAPFNDLDAALALVDENTAGFMVETVQGEGGMTAGTPEFITGLRKACDEQGMLLILDEIQCGYGRTGKFFAHEHYGITPDIMTMAKGIGGGFPLGACVATEEAAKGMVFGTHGSTYGGNPLAMAAGMAILDVMLEPGFFEHVAKMGERLRGVRADDPQPRPSVRGNSRQGADARDQAEGACGRARIRRASARQSRAADRRGGRERVPRAAAAGDRGKPHRRMHRAAERRGAEFRAAQR